MPTGTRAGVDQFKLVVGLHAVTPSSASPKWVSMKGYNHATIIISFVNSTTVTGAAIGLAQATAVAGTNSKTLPFLYYWSNVDDSASALLTQNQATGNTFTTSAVNSKSGVYVIEVEVDTLDMNNGFTSLQVTVGNATAQTIEVIYLLGTSARFGGGYDSFINPLVD